MSTEKWESEKVSVNTVWKVVNGCRRIRRELDEGSVLPADLVDVLGRELQLMQEAMYDAGY